LFFPPGCSCFICSSLELSFSPSLSLSHILYSSILFFPPVIPFVPLLNCLSPSVSPYLLSYLLLSCSFLLVALISFVPLLNCLSLILSSLLIFYLYLLVSHLSCPVFTCSAFSCALLFCPLVTFLLSSPILSNPLLFSHLLSCPLPPLALLLLLHVCAPRCLNYRWNYLSAFFFLLNRAFINF